jgi:hypothetical protein
MGSAPSPFLDSHGETVVTNKLLYNFLSLYLGDFTHIDRLDNRRPSQTFSWVPFLRVRTKFLQ